MASRLKRTDLPEPWFPPKKSGDGMSSRKKAVIAKDNSEEDSIAVNVVQEPTRRGRGRPKTHSKIVDSRKGKGKGNTLTPSTVDVVLGLSNTVVPDVDKLRQQREEDAAACGRTVRIIIQPDEDRSAPIPMSGGSDAGRSQEYPKERTAGTLQSPSKSFQNAMSPVPSKQKEVDHGALVVPGEVDSDRETVFVQRLGKESMSYDRNEASHVLQRMPPSRNRERTLNRVDSEPQSNDRRSEGELRSQKRSQSPPAQLYKHDCGETLQQRTESPTIMWTTETERYRDSYRRSSPRNSPQSSPEQQYRSRRRSESRSPGHWREGHFNRNVDNMTDYFEENAYAERYGEEYHRGMDSYETERRHPQRYESLSPQKESRQRRLSSPQRRQTLDNRSDTVQFNKSPIRLYRKAHDDRDKECRSSRPIVKGEKIMRTSEAVGREDRRQRQASREDDMERREKSGKKAFYLTVDGEGKPYGLGRPAWIAEINKLAKWLDPSCTHIRKQTYEDVQTFKDRLNEHFDYDRPISEDYLRGLMGKAITRYKSDFISLIRRGKKQPSDMDHSVWQRLEKLAKSRQREEKSEQGRHANACRKTIGRTGAGGEHGVREKLRSLYGRSPHPYEVEEEMQRDKGFGGRKRKAFTVLSAKEENNEKEVMTSDEGMCTESVERFANALSTGRGCDAQYGRHARGVPQRSARVALYLEEERHVDVGKSQVGQISSTGTEKGKISEEEYIQKLEYEIQRLRAKTADTSTLKSGRPWQ